MADSGIFRVKIELSRFFSDYKSIAFVSVDRKWKNVRQFHRHIADIFDVKKFILLTSDGVYLPGMYTENSYILIRIIGFFQFKSKLILFIKFIAKEHIGIIERGDIIQ